MRGRSVAAKPAPRRRRSSSVPVGSFATAHRCASLVDSAYDVGPTGRGGERCCQCGAHGRGRARLGSGLRGPDTTVFRVEAPGRCGVCSEYLGIDTTAGSCPPAVSCC